MNQNNSIYCCAPVEKKNFGYKKDMVFAILSGIIILLAFLLEKITKLSHFAYLIYYAIYYFFDGYYTVIQSFDTLKKKRFDIDFLMLVAAIGAAILGSYAEGGLLLFLFSLGHALEHYALDKATKSIASLSELTPDVALIKRDGKVEEISVEELKIGDIVVVRPNSNIPIDGVVVKGESAVNQAPITGASVPVDKQPEVNGGSKSFEQISSEHKVFAGTINDSSALEIRVLRLAKDSTLSRLVTLVQEAETQQAPAQRFADKFAAIFVPSVLVLVGILLFAFTVIDELFKDSFRSEEHTSELQSRGHLVCRLPLE